MNSNKLNRFTISKPSLIRHWDFKKNSLKIEEATIGQRIQIWWICSEGHSFQEELKKVCSRKKLFCKQCRVNNSLGRRHPELIEFFDEKKNGFGIYSVDGNKDYSVWWKCKNNHSIRVKPSSHFDGFECFKCEVKYKTIFESYPFLKNIWNYEKNTEDPNLIRVIEARSFHWRCAKKHEWRASVYRQAKLKPCCPFCKKNRKTISEIEEKLSVNFDNKKNPFTKFETYAGAKKKAWWICDRGHSFQRVIKNQVNKNTGCPECFKNSSTFEENVKSFLKSINETFESNVNFLKNGGGLDVYYPELKKAIEINGEYWHSDKFAQANGWESAGQKHLSKLQECQELGVELIYVWEDDWLENREKVEEYLTDFLVKGTIHPIFKRLKSHRD